VPHPLARYPLHHSSFEATTMIDADLSPAQARFARLVYAIAASYGFLVLAPGLFLEARFSAMDLPALTHPEFYYGFHGSALVWQIVFVMIAQHPARYRTMMLVTVFEKASYAVPCLWLALAGRLDIGGPLIGGVLDGVWMLLFAFVWWRCRTGAHKAATTA
jgi:hypothetical protein